MRHIAPVDRARRAHRLGRGHDHVADVVERVALGEHAQGLAADLVEDADALRRSLQVRPRRMVTIEVEHGTHPALGADDVGLRALGDHLGFELEQQRRGTAVERFHLGEVEAHAGRMRGHKSPHLRP